MDHLQNFIWRFGILAVLDEQGDVELTTFYPKVAISNQYVIYRLLALAGTFRQSIGKFWKYGSVVFTKNVLEAISSKGKIKVATNEN